MTALIAPEEPGRETLRVPVLKVFDGDGFLSRIHSHRHGVEFELSVRFGFIDAPEIGQPGGVEAKEFLESLISGKLVDLVVLTKMDTGGSVDRHGRVICVPYLLGEQASQGLSEMGVMGSLLRHLTPPVSRNIEIEMVLNGWAWVLTRYGPDPSYLEALGDARRNRRGIRSRDDNEHPWAFKKRRYRTQRRRPVDTAQPDLFNTRINPTRCAVPGCTGHFVERDGRYGRFFGNSNFPRCRHSASSLSPMPAADIRNGRGNAPVR